MGASDVSLLEQYGLTPVEADGILGVAVSLLTERVLSRVLSGQLSESDARLWGSITAHAGREITAAAHPHDA